jgi:hypothetical protein
MGAIFQGSNKEYRPLLWRDVDLDPVHDIIGTQEALLIGVNPSTADETANDHTIRKDIGFARIHGWRRIWKANLCDYRATDVRELGRIKNPISNSNDVLLGDMMRQVDVIVPCWGPTAKLPARLRDRWRDIVAIAERLGKPLYCFGTCNDGQPRHTLMLAYETPLVLWDPPL